MWLWCQRNTYSESNSWMKWSTNKWQKDSGSQGMENIY